MWLLGVRWLKFKHVYRFRVTGGRKQYSIGTECQGIHVDTSEKIGRSKICVLLKTEVELHDKVHESHLFIPLRSSNSLSPEGIAKTRITVP